MPESPSKTSRRRWDGWVALGYGLYTVLNLYPYSHPGQVGRIVPEWGDPLFDLWQVRWFAHQFFRDPLHLWDANVLYPQSRAMTFNDSLLGLALLAAPIGFLTGNWVLARNVLVLAGFFLSAWWTYRLALRLGAHPTGAWLAGLMYGFCSFRFHHLTNVKLAFGPLIPLFFLYLTDFVRTGRPAALGMAVGVGTLQMLSSLYYGFFLLTLAPIYGGILGWSDRPRWKPPPRGAWPATVGVIGIVGLALLFGYAVPYWTTAYLFGLQRSVEENAAWSADPSSYLATQSRLGFRWTSRWWNAERVLWPGSLAVFAVLAFPGRSSGATALWAVTGIGFLLSLGPRTPLFRWCYEGLPYFSAMRYPARWGVMAIFGTALLTALGVTAAIQRVRTRLRSLLTALMTLVAVVDLWHAPQPAVPAPEPPPVYRRLERYRDPGAVAVFPLYSNFREGSTFYGYWTTFHRKPVVGAYAAWTPPSFEWIRAVLAEFPSPHALWLAQRLNIRYLVFHPAAFRRVGAEALWAYYRQAIETLPPAWVRDRVQELEDVLLVLDLDRIRRDLDVRPPSRWQWQSVEAAWVQDPPARTARAAMTDGNPATAWVVPYTDDWHITVDFGRDVSLRAVRILTDPKEKTFLTWGSADGRTWRPVPTVPWWVWAGVHVLPDGREYPDPESRQGRVVLLFPPNRLRYLKLTAPSIAGHIAVSELQVILDDPHGAPAATRRPSGSDPDFGREETRPGVLSSGFRHEKKVLNLDSPGHRRRRDPEIPSPVRTADQDSPAGPPLGVRILPGLR